MASTPDAMKSQPLLLLLELVSVQVDPLSSSVNGGPVRLEHGVIITTTYRVLVFLEGEVCSYPSCFAPLQAFDAPLRLQSSSIDPD